MSLPVRSVPGLTKAFKSVRPLTKPLERGGPDSPLGEKPANSHLQGSAVCVSLGYSPQVGQATVRFGSRNL